MTISIGTILIALQALGELKNQGGSLASHFVGWVPWNQKPEIMKDLFIEVLNPYIHQKTIEENKNEEDKNKECKVNE